MVAYFCHELIFRFTSFISWIVIKMTSLSNTIHRVGGYEKGSYAFYPVLIVGAGESGIAMGCRLKQVLGCDQFRIFERQSGIGGTWWINRYPNVACDV
jgi:ribulose 1,5-bisphosphate synthetase/thiazole synthase